jgi:hypothetical protein
VVPGAQRAGMNGTPAWSACRPRRGRDRGPKWGEARAKRGYRSIHGSSRQAAKNWTLLIGIGRGLAAPLLPHHLAYESRTKAVRLITSALLSTGSSVSSAHHEHHSFEQLRFRQLYSRYTKGLLTTSTVRAFSLLVARLCPSVLSAFRPGVPH